ncbi:MAG: hypothetical protein RL094_699 [Candidatus Parcubacteria bacterium]|jgi:broad specificity phosphatase PhoE
MNHTPQHQLTLTFVRHGEAADCSTIEEDKGRQLTALGGKQASAVAQALAKNPIFGIFTSPAQRCIECALHLSQLVSVTPVVVEDLYRTQLSDQETAFDNMIRDMGRVTAAEYFHHPNHHLALQVIWAMRKSIYEAIEAVLLDAKPASDTPIHFVVFCHDTLIQMICAEMVTSVTSRRLCNTLSLRNCDGITLSGYDGHTRQFANAEYFSVPV